MSKKNNKTYAANIALSLPGTEGEVSANITLTPFDQVDTGGQVKALRDCTLADLTAFAQQLEAEVWQTYQDIKLVDLSKEAAVGVEVTVEDQNGVTVALPNWMSQAILLPAVGLAAIEETAVEPSPPAETAPEAEAPQETAAAAEPERDPAEPEAAPVEAEAAPVKAEEPEAAAAPEEPEPQVMVSESLPVFAEREAVDDPNAFPTPAIAPSQARVRIAGRRMPLGHNTWAAVDILIDEPALRAAQAHALSSPDREVAGVMLGPTPEKQPDGRYVVHVIDTVIAKYTVMHGASVTYTPESWRYMNDKLAERYPDESVVMVGWYHTHPGFGIFLSGMDQFIHQNFFTQVWHTALVLDPLARKSGFFCWDRPQTRVSRYDFGWPRWASGSW